MKNIQIVDDGPNCVYDIFAIDEEYFLEIFPANTNIAFIDEVLKRIASDMANEIFGRLWLNPIRKCDAMGIHGILFYGLKEKKKFYPDRLDETAINPNGGLLRNEQSDTLFRKSP